METNIDYYNNLPESEKGDFMDSVVSGIQLKLSALAIRFQNKEVLNEDELYKLAQWHNDEDIANAAFKELRERFDETYIYCTDCDYLLTRESDCCMNINRGEK